MEIELMADGDSVGILDNDGGIITAPKLDIFGQPFEKVNATYRYIQGKGQRYYVAIPTGKDHESLGITVVETTSIRQENVPMSPVQEDEE